MDVFQFELLIEEYRPQFKRYALSLVRNVDDAEDLIQSAFLKSFRHSKKLGENAQGYVRSAIRSAYVDLIRSRKLRETCSLEVEPAGVKYCLSAPERAELHEILSREINRLPPRTRQIMHDYADDFSYDEMAARAGICEGTVKSTLNRARKILQERLTDLLDV